MPAFTDCAPTWGGAFGPAIAPRLEIVACAPSRPDALLVKIATLNTPPCFAGYCDWRLPNRFELSTLINLGSVNPAVSAPFDTGCVPGCTVLTCSCTEANNHWTSSTSADLPQLAWMVDFYDGNNGTSFMLTTLYVRAVRGGS